MSLFDNTNNKCNNIIKSGQLFENEQLSNRYYTLKNPLNFKNIDFKGIEIIDHVSIISDDTTCPYLLFSFICKVENIEHFKTKMESFIKDNKRNIEEYVFIQHKKYFMVCPIVELDECMKIMKPLKYHYSLIYKMSYKIKQFCKHCVENKKYIIGIISILSMLFGLYLKIKNG